MRRKDKRLAASSPRGSTPVDRWRYRTFGQEPGGCIESVDSDADTPNTPLWPGSWESSLGAHQWSTSTDTAWCPGGDSSQEWRQSDVPSYWFSRTAGQMVGRTWSSGASTGASDWVRGLVGWPGMFLLRHRTGRRFPENTWQVEEG